MNDAVTWMGYKAKKNKRSNQYNIFLISKYKMKERMGKLTYPKYCLKVLQIMNANVMH